MFCNKALGRINEYCGAIQRTQVPLNYTNHQEDTGLSADRFNARHSVRVGNVYRRVIVAKELVSSSRSTVPDCDAKKAVLRIATNATG